MIIKYQDFLPAGCVYLSQLSAHAAQLRISFFLNECTDTEAISDRQVPDIRSYQFLLDHRR